MSYIRIGYPLKWVEGESQDYIYLTVINNKDELIGHEDIDNTTIVELCCQAIFEKYKPNECGEDNLFISYLQKKLAERLNVKLREKPLDEKEQFDKFLKSLTKVEE